MDYATVGQYIIVLVWIAAVLLILVTAEALIDWSCQRREHKRMNERLAFIQEINHQPKGDDDEQANGR